MVEKVRAGKHLLRLAGTVTRKLARWIVEKGHAEPEAARPAVEHAAAALRDLPAAEDLLWLLDRHTVFPLARARAEPGHYEFARVGPGEVWVREPEGPERGPIRLSAAVTKHCRPGWSFTGALVRRGRAWRLAEVWQVYPSM